MLAWNPCAVFGRFENVAEVKWHSLYIYSTFLKQYLDLSMIVSFLSNLIFVYPGH